MYEDDTPPAERRAAGALARPRAAARAARPGGAARPASTRARWRRSRATCSGAPSAAGGIADELHDLLRRVGDLRPARCASARSPSGARGVADALAASGAPCACARRRGALDRRRGRRAATATRSARCRPAGLPEAFLEPTCPTRSRALAAPLRARRTVPSTSAEAARALRPRARAVELLDEPRARGGARARRAAARRQPSASGATPRCSAACAGPRWPCCARRSSPPSRRRWRASCRAGRGRPPRRDAARGAACARCWCRSGAAARARGLGADVLPRRVPGYSAGLARPALRRGEVVWVGAGPRQRGRSPLLPRGRAPARAAGRRRSARDGEVHERIRGALADGALFWAELLVASASSTPSRTCRRSGIWSGRAR